MSAAVAPTSTRAEPVATALGAPDVTTPATTAPPTTATTDPGALPQTDEHPAASGAAFTAGVQGSWQAVQQDRPELAMPFFFPQAAYLQVKAISDPATDYEQRLVANYARTSTRCTRNSASTPRPQFASIDVPDARCWCTGGGVEPAAYWRVYGTTLHYTEDGQARSFP